MNANDLISRARQISEDYEALEKQLIQGLHAYTAARKERGLLIHNGFPKNYDSITWLPGDSTETTAEFKAEDWRRGETQYFTLPYAFLTEPEAEMDRQAAEDVLERARDDADEQARRATEIAHLKWQLSRLQSGGQA